MNRMSRQFHLLVAALVLFVGVPPAEGNHCECFTNNNTELRLAVQAYVANSSNTTDVAHKYGYPISTWCVESVTDMSRVFDGLNFTASLSGWKTGNAITMAYMFRNTPFNQPISQFDVSKVVDFTGMFFGARNFNQNISGWNVSSARFLTSMFDGNTNRTVTNAPSSFRQNLCAWSTYASSFVNVSDMFADTNCNTTSDPNLRASPPGPFCSICVNATVRSTCSNPASCASDIASSCKTTCDLTSTCFINATNYCCTNRIATSDYVKNVTAVYLQQYPTCNGTRTCLTPARCAANITTACNGTCAVNSTCFTNATKLCCSDRNATSDYVSNVTSVYLATYCGPSCFTPTRCAANVTAVCGGTCLFNSTCYVNATKSCCTDRNATSAYVANVTAAYESLNPACNRAGSCVAPGLCASNVATACNRTCSVNSTCFLNVTKACCTNGNATSTYIQNVTTAYQQVYCTRSCLTAASCAANITSACRGTCNVTSTCFTNATKFCCSDQNATAAYIQNVTTVYQQAYCTRSCLTAASCAANVTSACRGTCNVTSTCFTNATKFCCTDRNATTAYIQNVTAVYQQSYCAPSCLTAASCAANINATCFSTCLFNSTCFTNATKSCCTDRNATPAYVASVTAAYQQQNPACARVDSCVNPGKCASDVATACSRTCSVNSTCFVNATKACCTNGNATASYVQRVTVQYQKDVCNVSRCVLPRVCARRIFRACIEPGCGNTTTPCYRRTIRGCCTDRNATGQYQRRVRRRYQRLNGCRRDGCIRKGACARRAKNRCNSTCALRSTCFVNATNSCCPRNLPPTLYRTQVKEKYREKYCVNNSTTCTVDACAARAIRCSGQNCALNQVCLRNVTDSCCRPTNLTRVQLREEVVSALRRVCRRTCTPPANPLNACARRVRDSCRSTCSNRNKKCFRRAIQRCCVKGRIATWSNLVMRKYSQKYCKGQRTYGLGLGLFD